MKFDLSDRKTQIMLGGGLLVLFLLLILLFMVWPKRSKYTIADNVSGGATPDGAFQTDVTACQTQFNIDQTQFSIDQAQTNYNTCLQTAMTNLINRRCPYVAGNVVSSPDPNTANYTNYDNDLKTISAQYNTLIQAAPDATVSSAGPTSIPASGFTLQGYQPTQGMTVSPTAISPYGNGPELNFTLPTGTTGVAVGQTISNFQIAGLTGTSTVMVVYTDGATNVTLKWPNNTPTFTIPTGITSTSTGSTSTSTGSTSTSTTIVSGGPYSFAAGSAAAAPTGGAYTYASGTVTTTAAHNLQPFIMAVSFGSIGPFVVQTTSTDGKSFTINVPTGVTVPATGTSYTVDVLSKQIARAARKADITGATRKYLALKIGRAHV